MEMVERRQGMSTSLVSRPLSWWLCRVVAVAVISTAVGACGSPVAKRAENRIPIMGASDARRGAVAFRFAVEAPKADGSRGGKGGLVRVQYFARNATRRSVRFDTRRVYASWNWGRPVQCYWDGSSPIATIDPAAELGNDCSVPDRIGRVVITYADATVGSVVV